MKKWIPFYGMFTKEANDIPKGDGMEMLMILYHGLVCGGIVIYSVGYYLLQVLRIAN